MNAAEQLGVKIYATNIITYGNRSFTTIPEKFVEPVKTYIARNYTDVQIKSALEKQYITQEEFDEIANIKNSFSA